MEEAKSAAEELGKLLFACAQWAAAHQVDPEEALHGACEAFISQIAAEEQA